MDLQKMRTLWNRSATANCAGATNAPGLSNIMNIVEMWNDKNLSNTIVSWYTKGKKKKYSKNKIVT